MKKKRYDICSITQGDLTSPGKGDVKSSYIKMYDDIHNTDFYII